MCIFGGRECNVGDKFNSVTKLTYLAKKIFYTHGKGG